MLSRQYIRLSWHSWVPGPFEHQDRATASTQAIGEWHASDKFLGYERILNQTLAGGSGTGHISGRRCTGMRAPNQGKPYRLLDLTRN
jgi:hypothetical protein